MIFGHQIIVVEVQAAAAVVALFIAIGTILVSRRIQREQTARKAHLDYIQMAMNHPKLAYPTELILGAEDGRHFWGGESEEFEKYEWFVSYLLSTASYVWDAVGDQHILGRLMALQVAYHSEYLSKYRFRRQYLMDWFEGDGRTRRRLEQALARATEVRKLESKEAEPFTLSDVRGSKVA
jgi:hypothetical protein